MIEKHGGYKFNAPVVPSSFNFGGPAPGMNWAAASFPANVWLIVVRKACVPPDSGSRTGSCSELWHRILESESGSCDSAQAQQTRGFPSLFFFYLSFFFPPWIFFSRSWLPNWWDLKTSSWQLFFFFSSCGRGRKHSDLLDARDYYKSVMTHEGQFYFTSFSVFSL